MPLWCTDPLPEVQDLLTVLFVFRLRVLFSQNTVSRIDVGSFHCLSHVWLCCPFGIELGSCIFIYTPFGLFSLDLADFFSLSEYVNHKSPDWTRRRIRGSVPPHFFYSHLPIHFPPFPPLQVTNFVSF